MFQTIIIAYPKLAGNLQIAWQGCILDAHYQAREFAEKLKQLLEKPASEFLGIVWDPPHWVEFVIDNVIVVTSMFTWWLAALH